MNVKETAHMPPAGVDPLEEIMRRALLDRGQSSTPDIDTQDPFADAFAAPASSDQYVINVPSGIDRDGDLEAKARQWFHEAELPQGLVRGIVQEYCRCLTAEPQKLPDQQKILAELTRDWGADCARKVALARSVIARCGDTTDVEDVLSASGLGNNAWLIRSLAALAELPRPNDTALDDHLQGSRP